MQAARWPRSARARPLRCSRPPADDSACGGPQERLCRICWDGHDQEGHDRLVAPCACSGSMRYVHASCLRQWQQQLRAQKGTGASRRCDVCKAAWVRAHQPPHMPTHWRQMLRDWGRAVPWPAVLECYKFCLLSVGTVRGLQAGIAGFRSGMAWAGVASRQSLEGVGRLAPQMVLAAGTRPHLRIPMALGLVALVIGVAAQVALLSLVCAYAGSLFGFASGVAGVLVSTLQLGVALAHQGGLAAAAVCSGAARGILAAGRLAAPLGMALLKTLALSRLFS